MISLITTDLISISRISHPSDRFFVGQSIFAVVLSIEDGSITLSFKELPGNWKKKAAGFCCGGTLAWSVRSVEKASFFVELSLDLAGLTELHEGVRIGQRVSVYIKTSSRKK